MESERPTKRSKRVSGANLEKTNAAATAGTTAVDPPPSHYIVPVFDPSTSNKKNTAVSKFQFPAWCIHENLQSLLRITEFPASWSFSNDNANSNAAHCTGDIQEGKTLHTKELPDARWLVDSRIELKHCLAYLEFRLHEKCEFYEENCREFLLKTGAPVELWNRYHKIYLAERIDRFMKQFTAYDYNRRKDERSEIRFFASLAYNGQERKIPFDTFDGVLYKDREEIENLRRRLRAKILAEVPTECQVESIVTPVFRRQIIPYYGMFLLDKDQEVELELLRPRWEE